MILSLYSSDELKGLLNKKGLKKGVYLTEDSCGTNAVSLAMNLNKDIQLSNDKHYCTCFYNWDCLAAPLKIGDLVIGYIDISSINSLLNKELFALVDLLKNKIILKYMEKIIFLQENTMNLKSEFKDVLLLTADGYNIREISNILNISESAVKYRRNKLCKLYEANNLHQVIKKYYVNKNKELIKAKM